MTLALMFFRQEFQSNPVLTEFVLYAYFVALLILAIFGFHGFVMVYHYVKNKDKKEDSLPELKEHPFVTVQLPVYNELYVVRRLIESVCAMDYPRDRYEVQVLDDSTDETVDIVAQTVREFREKGFDISHVRRPNREGFKAGALLHGMKTSKGEFIAIFDADFVPRKDFLLRTVPYFFIDKKIGLVQTRWEHLNEDYSILTRAQALALDGHFVIEQDVRNKAGYFINFNGTGGIWRRVCIEDAGNWQTDTLTEDLDLSYRAQLKGWKFKYLANVTSPAELPSEVNALKNQQFRWTKGAIETACKMLPALWRSKLPFRLKVHSTAHLTNNLVFPFIILAGVLNVPLLFIKQAHAYDAYFAMMSIFVLAFFSSFLYYLYSQKAMYPDWRRRIMLFPLFMAGSMGFAVNNTRAVVEALMKKRSEFVRTPKYSIENASDSWLKKNKYTAKKVNWTVYVEAALAVYCFVGVVTSIYFLELAALPFHLLFFIGFSYVSLMSFKHALQARKTSVH